MKFKLILLTIFLYNFSTYSQNLLDGQIRWSPTERLREENYKIKVSSQKNTPIFSQFYIKTNTISGFEIFKKNFNSKVENIFIGNASWIENTKKYNLEELIEYQQLQFDLSEVYARKYRKLLLENKNRLLKNNFINELTNNILNEFSTERLLLEKETESGTNRKSILLWKEKILFKLKELNEFRYENLEKIKINFK